jgi:NAD(P)-dependent dehydrogenase (short-subunit alcohol dehydrogenase family)
MDVAVVTGAGSGIGKATAERLVRDGRLVVGLDRDRVALDAAAAALGERFTSVVGDVVERASHERAAVVAAGMGTLSGWVNNAGIAIRTRAHDFVPADMEQVLRVNVLGVALGCSVACAHFLTARTPGAIVNVSSIAAIAGFPATLAYQASKGGVDALTRQVAVEYGPAGIRCNGVRPGTIVTPLIDALASDPPPGVTDIEALRRSYGEMSPFNRMGQPSEIASVIAFLLSDDASFISGELINVDGGAAARCYRYPPDPEIIAASTSAGKAS